MSRSELPKDWRIASLEDVADFINGYSFKSTDWDISGLPIIRIQNLNDGSKPFNRFSAEIDEKYRVRYGDVLISWSASLGAYFWEGGDAWLNQHIFKAVINENTIDRDFFFWVMKNRIDKIAESARGSTMKHVTRKTFINSTIPLPPLPEQRAIARALRAVQGAREARQREVALEREHKAALMEHLFTHGTRGEATKMTEIGEMPERWEITKLGNISEISSGGTPSRDNQEYWNGNIPWVKTGEIHYNTIIDTEEKITQKGLENLAAKTIPKGTLLMAMYGQGVTRGKVGLLGISATINQACAAILVRNGFYTKFLFYYLEYSYERIRNFGHGANQKNLNLDLVRSITAPMPEISEQKEIATILLACDSKIIALDHEARLLEELFRAMLEELMRGRLQVRALVENPA